MISPLRKSSRATEGLLPGQISYLKKRAECDEVELLRTNISDGCFGHLVLIISTDSRKAQSEALIVSLFQTLKVQTLRIIGFNHNCSSRLSAERPSKRDTRTIAAFGAFIYQ